MYVKELHDCLFVLKQIWNNACWNSGNNLIRQKNASFLFYKKLSRRLSSYSYLNIWGQFNLIMLEHKLLNGIHKIKSKITTQKKMS